MSALRTNSVISPFYPKFHKEITSVGEELGIVPVIIRGEELNEKGFGGKFALQILRG